MLRPRESRDLRIVWTELTLTPDATLSWSQDVFGNAVATATFDTAADQLVLECVTRLQHWAVAWPVFDIAASAIEYPFSYTDAEWTDLGALVVRQYADPDDRLRDWAEGYVRARPTDTLSLLKDLCTGVAEAVWYQRRESEGTQSPLHTLDRGWGSCRDLAVLFADAVRSLGFAARLNSGYLHNPEARRGDTGATHAWAEVFVPGAGWITFDPTNRSVGGLNLIPVAVARDISQIAPVTGSFTGMTDAFHTMLVDVDVEEVANSDCK